LEQTTVLQVLQRTVLTGLTAIVAAACGVHLPFETASSSAGPVNCLVLADEEVVSLAWSQDAAHLGLGLRTASGRPAARTVDAVSMHAGELAEDDRMIPESVVVTADGELAWLRAGGDGTEIVEGTGSAGRVVEVPGVIDAIQWTAVGYAAVQTTPGGTARIVLFDPDRPDDPTVLYETRSPVLTLWVTPDPEWVLLTVGSADTGGASAAFIVIGPDRTFSVDASDSDGSTASMTLSRNEIVYRQRGSGRMVAVSTDGLKRRVLTEQPVRFGMVSGRDVLAIANTPPGEVCLLPRG
jgi:hypothetical protein